MRQTRFQHLIAVLTLAAWTTVAATIQASVADKNYYNIVTENNLFRKLGWSPPQPGPQFALVMVVGPGAQPTAAEEEASAVDDFLATMMGAAPKIKTPETPRPWRALITRMGGGDAFYVEQGEKVGNMTVAAITADGVDLRGEGEGENVPTERLTMQGFSFGAGGGGGGGGGRRGGGGGNRGGFSPP
ncbi:MAG: hypothetical protein O3A46_04090, partial [Candidatus Poribacteria bacterium]|nr:hypothetical protein [Candidatus Poribacteria bacterium]